MTVWIIEDNDLLRESIAGVINGTTDLSCPSHFSSCEPALFAIETGAVPDVILMDIGLPGINGIEGTRRIHCLSPTSRVLMLTVHEDNDEIFDAVCAGASGYLLKPSSAGEILHAIDEVRHGGSPMNAHIARKVLDMFKHLSVPRRDYGLTDREVEVLNLLVEGLPQKRIAEVLFLSEHTINTHIRNIYTKLHVHTRSGVVAKALKERLL